MRYSFESRIRYSETDENKQLDLAGIINYFQDCSVFHSEDHGVGLDWLGERDLAWLMSAWQIVIDRFPKLGEQVRISTWAYSFREFYGYRNFTLETLIGERLAYANSVWVYMNMKTGFPVRISDDVISRYTVSPQLDMDTAPRRIVLPDAPRQNLEPFIVPAAAIDSNHHVNNGQYIRMAEEYLPAGFRLHQMRADYRKSALLGDTITPCIYDGGLTRTVSLNDGKGRPYVVVEFTGRDEA